jgi:hypothetical protein
MTGLRVALASGPRRRHYRWRPLHSLHRLSVRWGIIAGFPGGGPPFVEDALHPSMSLDPLSFSLLFLVPYPLPNQRICVAQVNERCGLRGEARCLILSCSRAIGASCANHFGRVKAPGRGSASCDSIETEGPYHQA